MSSDKRTVLACMFSHQQDDCRKTNWAMRADEGEKVRKKEQVKFSKYIEIHFFFRSRLTCHEIFASLCLCVRNVDKTDGENQQRKNRKIISHFKHIKSFFLFLLLANEKKLRDWQRINKYHASSPQGLECSSAQRHWIRC